MKTRSQYHQHSETLIEMTLFNVFYQTGVQLETLQLSDRILSLTCIKNAIAHSELEKILWVWLFQFFLGTQISII